MEKTKVVIHWHRRDLRVEDNTALAAALNTGFPVLPIFIFDTNILQHLSKDDARVTFIHEALAKLKEAYETAGSSLFVFHGTPLSVYQQLTEQYDVQQVFTNRDYEPYAHERDKAVYDFLAQKNIPFTGKKDQVIFEKNEVIKDDGKPYTVFTPYSRKWKLTLQQSELAIANSASLLSHCIRTGNQELISLKEMGFTGFKHEFPSNKLDAKVISTYHQTRDIPGINGTTKLSVHLRFGTISNRSCVAFALAHNETWLNELIWRDFYQMILFHFPHSVNHAFKSQYDQILWRNNEEEFQRWCDGTTGYPIVDAGMRELNQTGHMHNRVRMIVASFLTKHLLIDWRWGERYFAEKLLDFDLASNVGGWQWAAGSGCDAAPYFRIFNPTSQTEKFDPEYKYIKHWVPEVNTSAYPAPIVDHKEARERCLATYKSALNNE